MQILQAKLSKKLIKNVDQETKFPIKCTANAEFNNKNNNNYVKFKAASRKILNYIKETGL